MKGWDLSKLHVERARWTTTRRGAGSFDWKERIGQTRGQGFPLPSQGGGRRGRSRRQGVHRFGGLRASRHGCSLVPVVALDGTHVFLCFLRAGGKVLGRRKEGARGSTRLVISPRVWIFTFWNSVLVSGIPHTCLLSPQTPVRDNTDVLSLSRHSQGENQLHFSVSHPSIESLTSYAPVTSIYVEFSKCCELNYATAKDMLKS